MPTKRKVGVYQKECPRCHEVKDLAEFTGGWCKMCIKEYKKKVDALRYEKELRSLRSLMIVRYGPFCFRCQDPDIPKEILRIYPAEGNRLRLMRRLVDEGFPPGYKIICWGCEKLGVES